MKNFVAQLGAAALGVASLALVASPAGAVDAGDETSFRAAWDTATEITLTADITLTCAGGGSASRSSSDPVVLDGAGHSVALEDGCLDRVLQNNSNAATTLRNLTVTGGNSNDDGGGYEHNGAGSLTVDESTFVDNTACSEGGGVEVEQDVLVTISRSTFVGNRSDQESALDLDEGGDLVVVNSTFTGNVTNENGAIGAEDGTDNTASLVYATIVGNVETGDTCTATGVTPSDVEGSEAAEPEDAEPEDAGPLDAGEPANLRLETGYTLRAFATVIADPVGTGSPTPNCDLAGVATESSGYNYSDDATCGFTATTDTEDGSSPQLGALASNGGPTQTMLPDPSSPLVNVIPVAECGGGDELAGFAVTTDQRGVTRPQETGCEIGAVELEAPVTPPIVIEPTFTG